MNNNKRFNYTIMKNVRFVTLAVAMLAAVTLLSSCSKSDDSVKQVVVSVADENCSIIATSNAEVTYSIDVPATKTISTDKSNTAYFTGIAAGTRPGYLEEMLRWRGCPPLRRCSRAPRGCAPPWGSPAPRRAGRRWFQAIPLTISLYRHS